MDIIDENKYKEFKYILSGCRTILDAYYFAELYIKKNPDMKNYIYSLVNGKRYESIMDFRTMRLTVEVIDNCQYNEDASNIIDIYSKKTTDGTQKRTLNRISKNKPCKPEQQKKDIACKNIKEQLIVKKCPHCNHQCIGTCLTEYVICGYTDSHNGYDWKGCGKDWCFKCGKLLCKSWETDKLFLNMNRYHDGTCCNNHASDYNKIYPNDYCDCININVNR